MDDIGDILGTIFEEGIFGDGLFGRKREEARDDEPPVVYERYLCGGPKELGINDR